MYQSGHNDRNAGMDQRQAQPSRHQRSTSTPDTELMSTTTPNYQPGNIRMSTNESLHSSRGRLQPSSGSTLEVFSNPQQPSSYHPHRLATRTRSGTGLQQDFLPPPPPTSTHEVIHPQQLSTQFSGGFPNPANLDSIDRAPSQAYERSSTITQFQPNHPHLTNSVPSFGASRSIELRRPDSVITTSSIVSYSDTEHGDSSTESSGGSSVLSGATNVGPPSVYAMSGLYGAAPVTCPVSVSSLAKSSSNFKAQSSLSNMASAVSRQHSSGLALDPFIQAHQTSGMYPKQVTSSATSNEAGLNYQPKQQSQLAPHPDHARMFPHHPSLAKSHSSSTANSSFGRDFEGCPDTKHRPTKMEGRIRTISLQQSGGSNEPSNNIPSTSVNRHDNIQPVAAAGSAAFMTNPHSSSCLIKRHRRQKSYPVTFQPITTPNSGVNIPNLQLTSKDPTGYIPAEISYKSTNPNGGGIENVLEAIEIEKSANSGGGTVVTLVRHGSNPINGHRRSHSYGPQRPSHLINAGHLQAQLGHRRTGSSVIETLQTLTGSCGHGDPNYNSKEANLAQFLEMLKKEQQEK